MERYEHVSEPTACVDLINIVLTLQRGLSLNYFWVLTLQSNSLVMSCYGWLVSLSWSSTRRLLLPSAIRPPSLIFFCFAKCVVFLSAPGPFSKCGFVIGNSRCFKCLAHTCLKTCTRRTNEQMSVQQQIVFYETIWLKWRHENEHGPNTNVDNAS